MHTAVAQLPDGQEIQVGVDRFKVPELLFQPVGRQGCAARYIGFQLDCKGRLHMGMVW